MEDGFIFVCKMFLQTTMQSMAATEVAEEYFKITS